MFDRLREPLRSVIGDDDQYESVFDAFEFIVGVLITATEGGGPFGRITQEAVYGEYRPSELAEHREALEKLTGGSAKLDESIETHSRRIREAHIYN